jgi:hypothetical protein
LFLEWLSRVTQILPSLLIILLLISLYGALGRDKYFEAHLPCICCKVKSQTTLERSVILLDQNSASVWNFWWNYTPLFDMISFSSFCFETWLSYSFMSLHVLIIFLNTFGTFMCPILFQHFFFSILFCIALLSLSRNMLIEIIF